MYKPKKYWEDRGKHYAGTEDPAELQYMLDTMDFAPDAPILEIGPGYGRIFQELRKEYANITMCDFVESMRKKCAKLTGILPDPWNGKVLPYGDASFEFVILFDVLLHVPPSDLVNILAEAKRVATRRIFVASYVGGNSHPVEHVFAHDYAATFTATGLNIVAKKEFTRKSGVNLLRRCLWMLSV